MSVGVEKRTVNRSVGRARRIWKIVGKRGEGEDRIGRVKGRTRMICLAEEMPARVRARESDIIRVVVKRE